MCSSVDKMPHRRVKEKDILKKGERDGKSVKRAFLSAQITAGESIAHHASTHLFYLQYYY